MLGAAQLAKEQMEDWKDGLLDLTYQEYQNLSTFAAPPKIADLDFVDAQTTIFFQSLRTFFRFRQPTDPTNLLKDAETYEAIRSYMREGAQVAFAWSGPVAFSPIGQNMARPSPTFQFTEDKKLGLVFPTEKATTKLTFPSPASLPCPRPEVQVKVFSNRSLCPLCAPLCQTQCVPGQREFVDSTGVKNCQSCSAGYFSVAGPSGYVTATECSACLAGSFALEAASTCTSCAPGTFQVRSQLLRFNTIPTNTIGSHVQGKPAQNNCRLCDDLGNFFQERAGQTECTSCPPNSQRYLGVLTGGDPRSCQCKEGYWRHDELLGRECFPCPSGGKCPGKSELPFPQENFWSISETNRNGTATHSTLKVCPNEHYFRSMRVG
jgi:hypothetical protein